MPADASSYTEGESVIFEGSGTDPEDGSLTGGSLVWTSNLDGQIGTGTTFAKTDLSVGNHTITLTVTDTDGATGAASVVIEMLDDVSDLLIEAFLSEFGLSIPFPAYAPTSLTPSGQSGWTSTAYIGTSVYRLYLGADSTVDAQIIDPLTVRPEGLLRVAVVAIDYGNTNITDVLNTLWVMAQDSINMDHADFASRRGYANPLVTFINTNALALSSEISGPFDPGNPGPFIDSAIAFLEGKGIPREDYDILMMLDLDADNPAGGFAALGGFWVYMGCYLCSAGVLEEFSLWELRNIANATYHHEMGHVWGWEHHWTSGVSIPEDTEGFITIPTLFGWEDTDGDGIPEILDPTPYGRP
jgi:hypothetical protein